MQFKKAFLISLLALSLGLIVLVARSEPLTLESLPKITRIATYAASPPQLHAATDKGLYVSHDEGKSWDLSYPFRLPATMISTTADGSLFAFVVGKGLLRMHGSEPMWISVSNQFGAQVLTQLSTTPADPKRL